MMYKFSLLTIKKTIVLLLGLGTKVFEGIRTFVGKPSKKSSNAFIN